MYLENRITKNLKVSKFAKNEIDKTSEAKNSQEFFEIKKSKPK